MRGIDKELMDLVDAAYPSVWIGEGEHRFDANEPLRTAFVRGIETGRTGWITVADVGLFLSIADEIHSNYENNAEGWREFYKRFPTEADFCREVMQRFINRKIIN